jgi:hypothetical protein
MWRCCMNKWLLTASLTLSALSLSAAQIDQHTVNPTEIRVVPVAPTPEPNETSLTISYPEGNRIKMKTPVYGDIRVEHFPLGVDSEFPRNNEIYNSSSGQTIRLVVDNNPYIEFNEALDEALDNYETDFEQTIEFAISNLEPGMHTLRAYPARSFGESLKGDKCFVSDIFYYKVKKDNPIVDLNQPFLTYNEPQGTFPYKKRTPILLDFYVTNCQLSKDGYKVRLSIDGHVERVISLWVPHYIYGLSQGKHQIRLELLDEKNKVIPGAYNDVSRTIYLK